MGLYPLVTIQTICSVLGDGSYDLDVKGDWSGILNSWGTDCPNGGDEYPCNNSTANFDSVQCDVHYGGDLTDPLSEDYVRTVFVTEGCSPNCPGEHPWTYEDIPSPGLRRFSGFYLSYPTPSVECGIATCLNTEIFPYALDPEGAKPRELTTREKVGIMKNQMKRRGKKLNEYTFVECEIEIKGLKGRAILPKHVTKGFERKSKELKIKEIRQVK